MLIEDTSYAPLPPINKYNDGKILELWLELRKRVGVVQAKQKPGMKFATRSNDDVINKVRAAANELGILIYPHHVDGNGFPVEDGTLATVKVDVFAQAVEDGSILQFAGFGLGADSQDKAGGKAGTYAFKQALLQAVLAQGTNDTDDTDTPIKGGVKKVIPKSKDYGLVKTMFETASETSQYNSAKELYMKLPDAEKKLLYDIAKAAKERTSVTGTNTTSLSSVACSEPESTSSK